MSRTAAFTVAAITLGALASSAEQPVPVGSPFQVNTYITGSQWRPRVSMDAAGGFVVIWENFGQDDPNAGIFGRRFDPSGHPRGAEFQVNTYTTGSQRYGAAAMNVDGSFTIVWEGPGPGDPSGVFARRYDASGVATGPEVIVPTTTSGTERLASVAPVPGGSVVAWMGADAQGSGVLARQFDDLLGALGPEFQVNQYTSESQAFPSIEAQADGAFLVAWNSRTEFIGTARSEVRARHYDSGASPLGDEFAVNTYTPAEQYVTDIGFDPGGGFVIAWTDVGILGSGDGQDGSGRGIYAQRYDSNSVTIDGEFRVNTYTTGTQHQASLAVDGAGHFVVAWEGRGEGSVQGIFARHFDAAGIPSSPDFMVNSPATSFQARPSVAAERSGTFVVAWVEPVPGGAEIYARRYVPDLLFADGVESGDTSAWSGLETDGDLAVTAQAALRGTTHGVQAFVNDQNPLYVVDESPAGEGGYRARFWIDPNDFDPGLTAGKLRTRVLLGFDAALGRIITLVLRRQPGGQFSLMARVRRNDGSRANTGFVPITDAPHLVEFEWWRSSGGQTVGTPAVDGDDGAFLLWIDGTPAGSVFGIANDTMVLDYVRLGAMSIKPAAFGTLYLDEFESWRPRARPPSP
jgi:hypothetical protein